MTNVPFINKITNELSKRKLKSDVVANAILDIAVGNDRLDDLIANGVTQSDLESLTIGGLTPEQAVTLGKIEGLEASASEIDDMVTNGATQADLDALALSTGNLTESQVATINNLSGLTVNGTEINNALSGSIEEIEDISIYGVVDNFLVSAVTGIVSASTSYKVSNFIPVAQDISYTYDGFFVLDTGIAGYDSAYNFIEKIARGTDINVNGVYSHTFTITNPNVKYIRCALKKTVVPVMTLKHDITTSIGDLKTKVEVIEAKVQDDIYLTFGTNEFNAFIINESNEYLQHRFKYKNSSQFNDIGWYSDSIMKNGVEIVQGNIHAVMIVKGGTNDNIYIGHGHGCEEELYSNFYLDGVEFNPLTQTTNLTGKELRVETYSKYYRPNQTNSLAASSEFTVAQLPLEVVATRFSDIIFTKYNKIEKNHTIKSMVAGLHFRELFTAMQQTNAPYFNGKLITNDRDGTRNYFPTTPDVPTALSPSTVVMNGINYGSKNSFCDTVIADGLFNGYSYLCSTTMKNKNSSLNSKCNVRAWCTRTTSNKFYFIPINTFSMYEVSGTAYDTFAIGDTISTVANTKITVKKN